MRYGKIDSSICRRGPGLPLPEKGENSAMEEKMNESAAVDELAQETQKVVYGEKTFEPHIPALALCIGLNACRNISIHTYDLS